MTTFDLRVATPDDASDVRRLYAPYVAETAISFEQHPPTTAEMRDRIESTLPEYPWLVVESDDAVVGYAYAGAFRSRPAYQWAVECSVYVDAAAHRDGVARSLYTALFALLERQGYRTVYAGMTVPNEASAGLHEAMGFTPVGTFDRAGYKHGEWHDVQWWQRPLCDPDGDEGSPTDPRPLTALSGSELVAALSSADEVDETDE